MPTLRFPVEAGVLVRGQVRRELKRAAWEAGLEISITEDKGLLESLMRVTVTGDAVVLQDYGRAVTRWVEDL